MTIELCEPDVLVAGAGPAGISAALAAASSGLSVVLTDEQSRAGGQVYRAPAVTNRTGAAQAGSGGDQAIGDALRARLAESTVQTAFEESIWMASPEPEVGAVRGQHGIRYRPKALIVATGAHERVLPVEGWTLPGVIGLAGATVLLKSQSVLPGSATVVAGSGPLVYAVAAGILKLGGRVPAVVDSSARRDWLRALPSLIGRCDLLGRGAYWMSRIRAAGTKIYWRHAITAVYGEGKVSGVAIRPLDAAGRPRSVATETHLAADAVAMGQGLIPNTEILRLLGADHYFDPLAQSFVVDRDADLRTSLSRVFAAGDGAAIHGAAAAELEGCLAGMAVAHDLGAMQPDDYDRRAGALRRRLARARRFGRAMVRLMTPPQALIAVSGKSTVVCRCEDVSRGQIEDAIDDGAFDLNQLKSWTRCGMGPCQGRICSDAVARILVEQRAPGVAPRPWTVQVPIRPVHLEALTGAYTYDDILADIPEPAPWDSEVARVAAAVVDDE